MEEINAVDGYDHKYSFFICLWSAQIGARITLQGPAPWRQSQATT
jgi:hypothetical protein